MLLVVIIELLDVVKRARTSASSHALLKRCTGLETEMLFSRLFFLSSKVSNSVIQYASCCIIELLDVKKARTWIDQMVLSQQLLDYGGSRNLQMAPIMPFSSAMT